MEEKTEFRPGFRLSEVDVGVLIAGTLLSIFVWRFDEWLAVTVIFAVGHFFLFCNVLRMRRPLELTWTALYLLLASSTILTGFPAWPHTFLSMLGVTAVIAAIQVRLPSYHGVFWQRLNPGLPEWWAAHGGKRP